MCIVIICTMSSHTLLIRDDNKFASSSPGKVGPEGSLYRVPVILGPQAIQNQDADVLMAAHQIQTPLNWVLALNHRDRRGFLALRIVPMEIQ
jgi:hypothetical protein